MINRTHSFRPAAIVLLLLVIGWALYHIGIYGWRELEMRRAEHALSQRDFVAARLSFERCLWLFPADAQARLLAAQTERRAGNRAAAQRHLAHCAEAAALRDAVNLERRLLQIEGGDLRDMGQLNRFCAEHPAAAETALVREAQIRGHLAALDPTGALKLIDWWETHRASQADRLQGLLWRAAAHELAGDKVQAVAACEQAVRLDPEHREARLTLAQLILHDDPLQALTHLQRIHKRRPQDAEVAFPMAQAERSLGHTPQAREHLDEALAGRPNWIEALVERGLVELDARQPDAAAQWLGRAERLSPKHRGVLLAMLEYLRSTGQTAEVERYQEKMRLVEAEVRQRLESALEAQSRRSSPATVVPAAQ